MISRTGVEVEAEHDGSFVCKWLRSHVQCCEEYLRMEWGGPKPLWLPFLFGERCSRCAIGLLCQSRFYEDILEDPVHRTADVIPAIVDHPFGRVRMGASTTIQRCHRPATSLDLASEGVHTGPSLSGGRGRQQWEPKKEEKSSGTVLRLSPLVLAIERTSHYQSNMTKFHLISQIDDLKTLSNFLSQLLYKDWMYSTYLV